MRSTTTQTSELAVSSKPEVGQDLHLEAFNSHANKFQNTVRDDPALLLNELLPSAEELAQFFENELPRRAAEALKDPLSSEAAKLFRLDYVQDAMQANIDLVAGRFRTDGDRAAEHPIRLAILLYKFLGSRWERQEDLNSTMSQALVHDVLEDGAGVSFEALRDLHTRLGHNKAAARAAVILTEPCLEYGAYSADEAIQAALEKIALLLQVGLAVEYHPYEAKTLVAAELADKIVNLFDLGFVSPDPHGTGAVRTRRLEKYLGSILYAHDSLAELSNSVPDLSGGISRLVSLLGRGLEYQCKRYGLDPEAVMNWRDLYVELEGSYRENLRSDIALNLNNYDKEFPELCFRVPIPIEQSY